VARSGAAATLLAADPELADLTVSAASLEDALANLAAPMKEAA
jgi:hypothetical protein